MRRTRPNIITEYKGRALDWRVRSVGDGFVSAELLTPVNLTDAEMQEASDEAIEAWGE